MPRKNNRKRKKKKKKNNSNNNNSYRLENSDNIIDQSINIQVASDHQLPNSICYYNRNISDHSDNIIIETENSVQWCYWKAT